MNNKQLDVFLDKLKFSIDNKSLVKLIISKKRINSDKLKKITITIIDIKKGKRLNFIYTNNTNDITKNYDIEEGIQLVIDNLNQKFLNADIYTKKENTNLLISKKGKMRLKVSEPTFFTIDSFDHDRTKKRYIETKNNIYLKELGITNSKEVVYHKMIDKYKQINRYVELLAPRLEEINLKDSFHIVDMGSGKGYLTFALFDYLKNKLNKSIKMTGVEFRKDLVNKCNTISEKADFPNLNFIQGTIEKADLDKIDVLIALHACDTATDEAIFRGISANASLIVCAPCCHKQIRQQMSIDNELNNIVKHGILKERQAEIITDTLRAMLMEANGYKTNIFEFISTEHTPKNLMIVGKKSTISKEHKEKIYSEIEKLKKLFGISSHYLEVLLKKSGIPIQI